MRSPRRLPGSEPSVPSHAPCMSEHCVICADRVALPRSVCRVCGREGLPFVNVNVKFSSFTVVPKAVLGTLGMPDAIEDDSVTLVSLGADELSSIAGALSSSCSAADRCALARSCRFCHVALKDLLVDERNAALQALHTLYCACGAYGANGGAYCPWLSGLRQSKHVHLKRLATVRDMPLSSDETRLLLSLVELNSPVEELVVDYTGGVEPDAVRIIAAALPTYAPSLVALSMAGCHLCDVGATSVASIVGTGRLRRLQHVSVEDNPFSPAARARLRQACRQHRVALSAFTEVENESIF